MKLIVLADKIRLALAVDGFVHLAALDADHFLKRHVALVAVLDDSYLLVITGSILVRGSFDLRVAYGLVLVQGIAFLVGELAVENVCLRIQQESLAVLVLYLLEMLHLGLVLHLDDLLVVLEFILLELGVLGAILLRVGLDSFEGRVVLDFFVDGLIGRCFPQGLVFSGHIPGSSVFGRISQVGQRMVLSVRVRLSLDDGPLLQVVAVGLPLVEVAIWLE